MKTELVLSLKNQLPKLPRSFLNAGRLSELYFALIMAELPMVICMVEKYCSICGCRLLTERPLTWFCRKCYIDWKEAIRNKEPWVIYLRNLESSRRYREHDMRKRGISLIYLGNEWDIDSDGNLVRREGRNG